MYHKITTVCVICIVLLSGCRAKKNIVSTTPAKTTTLLKVAQLEHNKKLKKNCQLPQSPKKVTPILLKSILPNLVK